MFTPSGGANVRVENGVGRYRGRILGPRLM